MTSITPQPGSLIGGKYRVERLLGEGGMGAVYSATHTISGKRVAIKWMHAEVAEHPEARQRFLREAQASARVRHPNVVDVYDVIEEDGALFLVMELLDGEALSDLMNRENTSMTELISLLVSAMRGVAAAHRQGIVHRDIKPDNIFLARVGDDLRPVPKVLDFGISKLTGINDASITKTGMALGTPLYMSVEQLSGVKDIDARTDIYAFGVILYQAVTGQPPFEADTFPVLIAKIMTEQARSPKLVRPDMPTTLSRLIEWAMAKNRDERIGSIDELIRELEPFASDSNFRAQMTIGASDIPHISTPSSRPAARASVQPREQRVSDRPVQSRPPTSSPPSIAMAPTEPHVIQPRLMNETTLTLPVRRGGTFAVAAIGVVLLAIATWWFTREPLADAQPVTEPNVVVPAALPPAPAAEPVAPEAAVEPPVVAAPLSDTPPADTSPAPAARIRRANTRVATAATPTATAPTPITAPTPSPSPTPSTRLRTAPLNPDDFK